MQECNFDSATAEVYREALERIVSQRGEESVPEQVGQITDALGAIPSGRGIEGVGAERKLMELTGVAGEDIEESELLAWMKSPTQASSTVEVGDRKGEQAASEQLHASQHLLDALEEEDSLESQSDEEHPRHVSLYYRPFFHMKSNFVWVFRNSSVRNIKKAGLSGVKF